MKKKFPFYLVFLVAIILINLFVVRIVFIYGSSMEPTLSDKQLSVMLTFNYKPTKQDIVVTSRNNELNQNLIKRVIGTEEDSIKITEEGIFVNGEKLSESYLLDVPTYAPLELTVPTDMVFLLGDNRNHSTDSREIGCIPTKELLGKILKFN